MVGSRGHFSWDAWVNGLGESSSLAQCFPLMCNGKKGRKSIRIFVPYASSRIGFFFLRHAHRGVMVNAPAHAMSWRSLATCPVLVSGCVHWSWSEPAANCSLHPDALVLPVKFHPDKDTPRHTSVIVWLGENLVTLGHIFLSYLQFALFFIFYCVPMKWSNC